MSWEALLGSLDECVTWDTLSKGREQCEALLRSVIEQDPAIYWYPGSGDDLTPLVLDVPSNPTGRRLFPVAGVQQGRPLLLWMNDFLDYHFGFPSGEASCKHDVSVGEGIRAKVEVLGPVGRFLIPCPCRGETDRHIAIPLAVFQIRVKNRERGSRQRPDEGDVYTVFFSAAESEFLFRQVLAKHRIRIEVVALIAQAGFSIQRSDFQQYREVPLLLTEHAAQVGPVQAYLVDHDVEIPGPYVPTGNKVAGWGVGGATWWTLARQKEVRHEGT